MNPRAVEYFEKTAVVLACGYILLWIYISFSRITFPYELEWMEGATLESVQRILNGHTLYIPPSFDFIPAIYTPLFLYVSAGFAKIFGDGFFPLRLVSMLSTFGCLGLIYGFVKRETLNHAYGLIAAGLFAATFRVGGAWFDVARVDMLFLFFMLLAIYLLRFHRTAVGFAAAGLTMALAVWTKQSAILIFVAMLGYAVVDQRKLSVYYLLAFIACVIPLAWYVNSVSDGWFFYYTFSLPSQHGLGAERIHDFFAKDLLHAAPLAAIASGLLCIHYWKENKHSNAGFTAAFVISSFAMAFACRAKPGGYDNCLIPVLAAVSICGAIGAHSFVKKEEISDTIRHGIGFALVIQFLLLVYSPDKQIPTAADREAGDKIVNLIRNADGEVYIPNHGYLAERAGKTSHAHMMAMQDIIIGDNEEMKEKIRHEVTGRLRDTTFKALILDDPAINLLLIKGHDVRQYYTQMWTILPDSVFWPVTGGQTRPQYLLANESNPAQLNY